MRIPFDEKRTSGEKSRNRAVEQCGDSVRCAMLIIVSEETGVVSVLKMERSPICRPQDD